MSAFVKKLSEPLLLKRAAITILHGVGLVGLASPYQDWFLSLTPLHLLVVTALLLSEHQGSRNKLWGFVGLVYVLGFSVEAIGVNTGLIFGAYFYTGVLGPQLWSTPLMIGVNWVLVSYLAAEVLHRYALPLWVQVVVGSLLLTLTDVLIEPAAIHLEFWYWASGTPPLQNYVAWFIVGLIAVRAYFALSPPKSNPLGLYTYGHLLFFFLMSNFI